MRLRRLAAGAVAGAGLVAAANRALRTRAGTLPPALVGGESTFRWRGLDVAYTEAGDPDDPDLLCLHGVHAAASSREFEQVFEALAEEYHVVAPDLPGFGRSDRPPVAYTAGMYEAFVAEFASEMTEDAVCLASSLTGAYAASAAETAGFSRLVLVCPTADTGPRRPWLRSLLRTPVLGEGLFSLLTTRPALRYFDERDAYADAGAIDDDAIDYQWRTAHQRGARYAPASFVGGFLDTDADLADVLGRLDVPVTLVWGREATITPLAEGRALADAADCRLVVVGGTRLLPHAEAPEEFLEAVAADLPRLEDE